MTPPHDFPDKPRHRVVLEQVAGEERVRGRAVVVCAHADDETVGLGGRLAAFDDLTLVHVTDGAPRDMADALRAGFDTRQAYAAAREAELDAALTALGADRARRAALGVPDQDAVLRLPEIVPALEDLLRGAEVVITHAYEGGHPDHDACAFAVAEACRRLGDAAPVRVEFAGYYDMDADGALQLTGFFPDPERPEMEARLTPAVLERKRRAAACFASQQSVIGAMPLSPERYRLAPAYDFAAPPPPGGALYDRWGLSLDSRSWREAVRAYRDAPEAIRR